MKRMIFTILFITAISNIIFSQERLRRSDSFFGWHFDFHAIQSNKELGKDFDAEVLDEFLKRTKPDYIQIDSKGHPGYSSYPTEVGYSANSFKKDPIEEWKKIADKYNIPVYVHYSGLMDNEAVRRHPEWSRLNCDGTKDKTMVGYFSKYTDELLIPQIKEMIDNYQIDGAWIDGECWAALPDYSLENTIDFLSKTGLKEVPCKPTDKNFELWKQHNRESFKNYLRNYVNSLHKYKPAFQITSNWAFTSRMPEPVTVDFDFLSGDVAPQNCIYSAAFEARCIALQGKSWDLMSWGIIPVNMSLNVGKAIYTPKPIVQLKQEAAEAMAMGGGYQVYFRQNRDGSFQQSHKIDDLVDLANFCRERQPYCQNSKTIPQIGIWYSLKGWQKENKQKMHIYGNSSFNQNLKGILNLFLDGKKSVEILMDHHMNERLNEYPLIVIPEWDAFDKTINEKLIDYVNKGGNLIIIGAKTVQYYKDLLEVSFDGKLQSGIDLIVGDKHLLGGLAALKTDWQPVIPAQNTKTIGKVHSQADLKYITEFPVSTINSLGKGKVAAIYMDFSPVHHKYRNSIFYNILDTLINELVPNLALKVKGTSGVHVVLGKKNNHTLIHLINSGGPHADNNVFGYDELHPTPKFIVSLKTQNIPYEVRLQPDNRKLNYIKKNDRIEIEVPSINFYSIIQVIPQNKIF